jgi:hypothetical protein
MAKSKRSRRSRRLKQRRAPQVRQRRPSAVVSESAAAVPQAAPKSFAEEYQYVIADLKRIFVLAGVMLALLVLFALVWR